MITNHGLIYYNVKQENLVSKKSKLYALDTSRLWVFFTVTTSLRQRHISGTDASKPNVS